MVECLSHPDDGPRQAASYGIGVMATFGGPAYHQVLGQALPALVAMIQAPHSREMGNVNATENAISAIVRIVKYALLQCCVF